MVSTSGVMDEEARIEEQKPSAPWKKLISFPVFLGALLAGVSAFQARIHLADPDTWWHAKVGQLILATHHFPAHDIYSFTVHGNPWISYEWLGEVLIGWAGGHGVTGLLMLLSVLSGLLMLLLYVYGTVCTGNVKASLAACALLLPLEAAFFTLRPQVLAYSFLLVLLILMELYRQGHEKVLWAIPPLFLVWVNTHGSFFIGLGIFGVFWLCGLFQFEWGNIEAKKWTTRQSRNLLLTALASLALLPLTPYGTKLASYPLQMMLFQPLNIKSIQEWQPVSFGAPWGKAFLLILLGLFLVQLWWKPRFRLFDLVFLLVTIFAGAIHIRFITVLVFACLPWLTRVLGRWLTPYAPSKDQYALNAVLIALIVFGLIYFFPSPKKIDKRLGKTYPITAISYLKTHEVPGPMLNEYGWGGYLIWTFGTSHPVFIDGRADIYEYGGVLKDYLDVTRLNADTPFVLAKYDIRSVFMPANSILATYLKASRGWSLIYQDKMADIFVFHGKYPQAPTGKS
ncbi:MAG TPA: hypothetical protein VNJ52_10935 [Patescibacteria group bacterium]|nr:hypothetical protein [Patescibacteria group bacterium]